MRYLTLLMFALLIATLCSCGSYHRVQGVAGPKGDPGIPGNDGHDGAPGSPGQPGEGITVVQFCPGAGQPTYGNFPEFGQCIDNKLYAVFWDGHQAWWSQIPPGAYLSTATGLACSFHVDVNCQVLP